MFGKLYTKKELAAIQKAHFLKVRQSSYGHLQYQCPICKTWLTRTTRKSHFTSKARREALAKTYNNLAETTHLDFYLENTNKVLVESREWKIVL